MKTLIVTFSKIEFSEEKKKKRKKKKKNRNENGIGNNFREA